MTLEEIFKDEPDLLENPTVIKLINYVKGQHARMVRQNEMLVEDRQRALNVAFKSDCFVIGGQRAHEALYDIVDIL